MHRPEKPPGWIRGHKKSLLLIGVASVAVIAILVWALRPRRALPPYIAVGNGRIEATEYDVATKLAGHLADLGPHEGDMVQKDAVVGHIEASEVNAQWESSRSQARSAADALRKAEDNLRSAESQYEYARATLARTEYLRSTHATTGDKLDRDRSSFRQAKANLSAAHAQVEQGHSDEAAAHSSASSVGSRASEAYLKAPVTGRVLYRVLEPGAMLDVGGKVLTLLDLTDVYITVFLPTEQVGKLHVGDEARVVVDALPGEVIPARVRFVSPRNQFTPREVETRKERDKLMFR
jgi:HlyD family secretion protein